MEFYECFYRKVVKTSCSFIILTIICYTFWFAIAYYDKTSNYIKVSNTLIEDLRNNNSSKVYELIAYGLKDSLSIYEIQRLVEKSSQNKRTEYFVSKIFSSDNFQISCVSETEKIIYSLGGGWGRGWKITAIEQHRY